jgi:uncharacterized membrane protein
MRLPAVAAARPAALIALGLLPVAVHLALAGGRSSGGASGIGEFVSLSLVAASALPHTLVYCALLVAFGSTLLPGRDPLVTALARRMHGAIPDDMASYTRGVTWAWCCFFAAQLATSLGLFLWAPLAVWSFFVNVVNMPSVVLMFLGEHAYRLLHLRNPPHYSPADVLRMIGIIKESIRKRASVG